MILKYKTSYKKAHDVWHFVDGIDVCSLYFDQDANCTCVEIGKHPNHEVIELRDEAYLINDNGKTIERIK